MSWIFNLYMFIVVGGPTALIAGGLLSAFGAPRWGVALGVLNVLLGVGVYVAFVDLIATLENAVVPRLRDIEKSLER